MLDFFFLKGVFAHFLLRSGPGSSNSPSSCCLPIWIFRRKTNARISYLNSSNYYSTTGLGNH